MSLQDAALESYDNMYTLWVAGTLKVQLTSFYTTSLAIFPESDANSHPCSNWLVLLSSTTALMPGSGVPFASLVTAADQMWRLCMLAFTLAAQGIITNAQATALLAAYTADIA